MASSLQTLIKILRLEQQKGYQNKAVIGGFARFAYHWSREAHSQAKTDPHHALVDEIVKLLREYDHTHPDERPAKIEEIIALATGESQVEAAGELAELPLSPPAPPAPEFASSALADKDVALEPTPDERENTALQDEESAERVVAGDDLELFEDFEIEAIEPKLESVPPARVRERRGYAWKQSQLTPPEMLAELDAPIETVSGVGRARAELLERLGVRTVRDLLFFLPRRYDDYSRMKPINKLHVGEDVSVIGVLDRLQTIPMKRGGMRVEAYLSDGSSQIRLNWFNQPWMEKQLENGEAYVVSGKVEQYLGRLVMNSPEIEPLERESLNTGRVVPVYPLTQGLSGRIMRRLTKQVVDEWAARLPDPLPLTVREHADLMDYGDAVAQAHFPDTWEDMQAALRRLAFDELFLMQLVMLQRRHLWQSRPSISLAVDDEWLETYRAALPYQLTNAQRRAIEDIRRDMESGVPMNRLLQGDVGSGKTVVAAIAAAIAVANGVQAAIMAPTSILAEQHYTNLCSLLGLAPLEKPATIALLTSHIGQNEREAVYAGLADGSIQVVIGTHALIQQGVAFRHLGIAVIDEQHRFGVTQRGALRDKADGGNPHLLVMTATPIPRTLALTLHADLDLTVLDEMPLGRTPVQTRVIQPRERERAYSFIRAQVEKGHQAYIICPLIEESDKLDARSAVAEYERLQNTVFPDLKLGLIHGRLSSDEKEAVMEAFYHGETQVLVSTTVIEVGIDVPSATVILVENANRFGLAQLHQLRGRVGRGRDQGYCLLLSDKAFLDSDERLRAVEETTDGFRLAEIDWQMRGAGDLLGTRQSGSRMLRFANLMDTQLVDEVQREARALFESDPLLQAPEVQYLARLVADASPIEGDIS